MNTLKVETEIKNSAQATDAVELIDCGRASERTQGFAYFLLWEAGTAPTNKLFLL
jgi:hypothetical protein